MLISEGIHEKQNIRKQAELFISFSPRKESTEEKNYCTTYL